MIKIQYTQPRPAKVYGGSFSNFLHSRSHRILSAFRWISSWVLFMRRAYSTTSNPRRSHGVLAF